MDRALTRTARFLGVGGVAAIVFGIAVLVFPGISLAALTALFGAFALVYGSFGVAAGLSLLAHRRTEWVPYLLGGAGGVLIGVVTFLHPAVTVLVLTYLIGAWAFMIGVFEVMSAIEIWHEVSGAAWLAVSGVLSILFGVIIAIRPGAGLLAILWLIGVYAIAGGITRLIAAFRIHQFQGDVRAAAPAAMRPSTT